MAIVKATVVKGKAYPRNDEIIRFFKDKGLYESTNDLIQFDKLQEEVNELEEALTSKSKAEILSEAGDVYICLLNVLHCCGLDLSDAVDSSVDKVTKRKGKVKNGMFVKEE
jgi:NTP pyrophosphatase (non-canonical NTP hydrolase)